LSFQGLQLKFPRISLDAELIYCRDLGIWESETSAGTYLNQWIRAGWLRELDDILTKTDASEVALRFCLGLEERNSGTTASHLRIVQEAVRNFAVELSPNIDERVRLLGQKRTEIQKEMDALQAGVLVELTEVEQRERIYEIYQLASALTGDFRRVEDEIRQLDQQFRVQIIEGGASRGDVLLSVMEKENLLASTDAGSAFESFFKLLCDPDRSLELREQIRSILSHEVAQQLRPRQQLFLGRLMRELSWESDRVFQIRRRTEESLRGYIESGAAQENLAVDKILSQLERIAVELTKVECDLQAPTSLILPVGSAQISSPKAMRLKTPDEKLDCSNVKERLNSREPGLKMLDCLDTVQVQVVAEQIFAAIKEHGPMTIAAIVGKHPLNRGLEELVAYLRVAKSVGAPLLEEKESIIISDKKDTPLKASIPVFLLSADLFPHNLNELIL